MKNWMRSKNTIEYLGLWEMLNNPDFKGVEFDPFLKEASSHSFTMSPSRWIEISIDRQKLIYGALLHDYFLYDWHKRGNRPPFTHGFTHPRVALQNAQRDYMLSYTEKDIIKHHMFPLMFIPPRTKEGWIVCIADKVSTLCEIFDNKTGSK